MNKRLNKISELVVVALVLSIIIVGLQILNGAYTGEFGDNPDEPAHVVTGLMVGDYISGGFSGHPMSFAEKFYAHYPKVAIGHWPPVFYMAQALWSLVFTPSRFTFMAFMAVNCLLAAITLYLIASRLCGRMPGVAAAIMFVLLPVTQKYSGMVMADIFGVWLALAAVYFFGRFLLFENPFDSVAFGLIASLSILTRGGSLALGLVPVLSVVLSGRFSLLKKISFWLPLLIVVLICGPWYWFAFDMMKDGFENPQGLKSSLRAAMFYFPYLPRLVGVVVFLTALTGFLCKVGVEGRDKRNGMWVAMAAMGIAVPLFHCIVTNAYDSRYLLPALPALLLFAVVGALAIGSFVAARTGLKTGVCRLIVALVAVASFALFTFEFQNKRNTGYAAAVKDIMLSDFDSPVWLVVSDAVGEGMIVANTALNEQRPGHILLRSSKELASSAWDGSGYKPVYDTPEQVFDFIVNSSIGLVVADYTVPPDKDNFHNMLAQDTLEMFASRLVEVAGYPCRRGNKEYKRGVRVFKVIR